MRVRFGQCESCGARFPLSRMRRLVWALVCRRCEQRLSAAAEPAAAGAEPDAGTAGEPAGDMAAHGALGFHSSDVVEPFSIRRHVPSILFYLALALAGRFSGDRVGALIAGGLAAEVLCWCLFSLIRTPLEGHHFTLELFLRILALVAVHGPGLPWLVESARLDLGAVGFFAVLICRALWFACWWNDLLAHDEASELEDLFPD